MPCPPLQVAVGWPGWRPAQQLRGSRVPAVEQDGMMEVVSAGDQQAMG